MKTGAALGLTALATTGAGALTYVTSSDPVTSGGVSAGVGLAGLALSFYAMLAQRRVQPEEDAVAAQGLILQGTLQGERATRAEGAVTREAVREDGDATRVLIREEFEKLAEASGLSVSQVEALLKEFGHEGIPRELWFEKLKESATRLDELETRLRTLTNDEPEISNLLTRAAEAIDEAKFDEADALLAEAEQRDREEGERRIERAARSREQRADLARSAGRYDEAAKHYAEAAHMIQGFDPMDWARLKHYEGLALYERGQFDPEPQILRKAVAAFREALRENTRERVPHEWATIHNNLGNALLTIGKRGDDVALADAIAAYREALKERTRERAPLDWAMTQNNLGNAFAILGERGNADARADAVAAYREALKERTRERVPLDWAMTQNNLGGALLTHGEHADDVTLRDAIAAFREALKERTRERVPLGWAATQSNLGIALRRLGTRGDDDALRDAIAAYREALKERQRERVPLDWAGTQNNLGIALETLGERGDEQALADAIVCYKLALEEYTEERASYYHQLVSINLARAEMLLEEQKNGRE